MYQDRRYKIRCVTPAMEHSSFFQISNSRWFVNNQSIFLKAEYCRSCFIYCGIFRHVWVGLGSSRLSLHNNTRMISVILQQKNIRDAKQLFQGGWNYRQFKATTFMIRFQLSKQMASFSRYSRWNSNDIGSKMSFPTQWCTHSTEIVINWAIDGSIEIACLKTWR